MTLLSAINPFANISQLRKGKQAATINRLASSQHVADLRLLFSAVLWIAIILVLGALVFTCESHAIKNDEGLFQYLFEQLVNSGPFIGAVAAVVGAVWAWTYQTGSARLGVVDLFACEITTLCRVSVVADAVKRFIDMWDLAPTAIPKFSSDEKYFTVFEATTKDLQQLEEKVVKNVTGFYTYMKVARDYMRKLADIQPGSPNAEHMWREIVGSILYMLFLAMESARKAVEDLIEFEPTRAEELIVIYLSEIVAYDKLRAIFTDDLRRGRLKSRDEIYRREIPKLLCKVKSHYGDPDWAAAQEIGVELQSRYNQVFLAP